MAQTLKKVGCYRLIKKIGSGATSQVFEGRKDGELEKYAVKMIKIKSMSKEQKELITKQVMIIKQIEHINIVKLYETLETPNNYYLVFQFCQKGDLQKYLKQNMENLLEPDHVRKIIKCISQAILHLHAKGIAHRDIKLANILLKKDLTIKLADFGFARESNNENVMMKTYCGTPITMAPQILLGKPYDKKCDIWSLGVILFQLIFGKLPFPIDQGYGVFIQKVTKQKVKIPHSPKISNSLLQLLFGCLERDQFKRYSIQQFLESKWMNEQGQQKNETETVKLVTEVLKKVSKTTTNVLQLGHVQSNEQDQKQIQKFTKQLAKRVYNILCIEFTKILQRHETLRRDLLKLVDQTKELKQLLFYYDALLINKFNQQKIKLKLEGVKDVEISVNKLKDIVLLQKLSFEKQEQCQAAVILMNYLKKLSTQQCDLEKKKTRYEIVIKFIDFIQNFDLEISLYATGRYQLNISLEGIVKEIMQFQQQEDKQEDKEYIPDLNVITIAMECIQKQQKFRESANNLKINCMKRLDAIQREINGY